MSLSRAEFLKQSGATFVAFQLTFSLEHLIASGNAIPHRVLGKTGINLPMLGIGGHHLGLLRNSSKAIYLVHYALDLGIKFIDTANCYQSGSSESFIGKALYDRRDKAFLMTKVHGRTRKAAARDLDESLKRLKTDHIDLWQFHNVKYISEVDKIFSSGGAIEAALAAQKAGKIKYIGLTGHYDAHVQEKALDYHKYLDTIQVPVNPVDVSSNYSYFKHVLPKAKRHKVGIIAMKTLVKGKLLRGGIVTANACLRFAWSQGAAMLVSGMDRKSYIRQNIESAHNFHRMKRAEQEEFIRRVTQKTKPALEHYRKR